MRVRYLIQLKDPIRIEDHWPIPIMGGDLRVITEDGLTTGFEISFTGQSVKLAPMVERHDVGDIKLSIKSRDTLLPFVQMQLEKAFSYLKCYFDVEILIRNIEIGYVGETEEEEKKIEIKSWSAKPNNIPVSMPYDLLTRAIMAAEGGQAPEFEATLVNAARTALLQERYIDSFRYAFLLIESLYGKGKFKAAQLKEALKESAELKRFVKSALQTDISPRHTRNTDTEKLLSKSPSPENIIDHLVDKRGFYFHGNLKRKDAWRPHEQHSAESLALLSLEIAMLISHAAAAPMFDDRLSERHLEYAKRVGAIVTMNVSFRYREPGQASDRTSSMDINVPGTKATPRMVAYVAKSFLQKFEEVAPHAELKSATCTVKGTGQKAFDINFYITAETEID